MGKSKLKFTKEERALLQKNRKQGMKIPENVWNKIKTELLDKYEIKGFQTLCDYLIVSGIVYLKRDIIEVVRGRLPEFKKRYTQMKLSKFGKAEKVIMPPMKQDVCFMYDRDYIAFNNFCIEEDVKKFWVIQILMEEFAAENPVILEHIKRCKTLKTEERKKQISRLLNDEYIEILPEIDAIPLLKMLTERYDQKKFGGEIGLELDSLKEKVEKAAKEKEEEENALEEKRDRISRLRKQRAGLLQAITEPVEGSSNGD